jgi:hypothetical protein
MIKKGVFISFCWDDLDLMNRVCKAIERNQYLYPIVVTNPERADSQLWNPDKVGKGIVECSFFVPIISSNSLNNQWVNQQIGFAAALKKGIYPLVQQDLVDDRKLKGWVNPERDQPYRFKWSDDVRKSRKFFREAYKPLIEHLATLNETLVFSNLLDSQKQTLKGGKLVFYQENGGQRAFLILHNYAYPIASGEMYSALKGFLSQKKDERVEKDVIDKLIKGQSIT